MMRLMAIPKMYPSGNPTTPLGGESEYKDDACVEGVDEDVTGSTPTQTLASGVTTSPIGSTLSVYHLSLCSTTWRPRARNRNSTPKRKINKSSNKPLITGIVRLLISIACADDAWRCPNPNAERCELGVMVYILPNPKDNVEERYALGWTKGANACWAYCGGVRGVE